MSSNKDKVLQTEQKQQTYYKQISLAEAQRAIFIDFEGFVKETPSLIGICIEKSFEQIVLTEDLRSAANAKNLRFIDGNTLIKQLVNQAKKENRRIVAFSTHELAKCREYFNVDLSPFYCNANSVAKAWKRKKFPEIKKRFSGLKQYLSFIGFERGAYLGDRQSTQRIQSVRKMLAVKGDYEKLTPTVKAKWTKLLEHNEIDVLGMKKLVLETFK